MASRDLASAWPMAQPTSQPVLMRPETVEGSAVLVDATLRRRDRILSSVSDSVRVVTEGFKRVDWTHSVSGLPRRDGSVMDECTDFAGGVAAVATSPVVFVGDVAVEVMLPTVAGAAAEIDAADAISLADAGMVTVGVTDLADAGILFPADPTGVVTIGVAPLADAEMVTVTVTDLADAGILFSADLAWPVTVGVADLADAGIPFLADAEMVTVGVTDLADAGMAFPANPAGAVTVGVASLADAGMFTICVTDLADARRLGSACQAAGSGCSKGVTRV